MNSKMAFVLRRVLHEQSGQAIWWAAAGIFGFIGMAGMTIDVGRAYVAYDQLQASTNAAALAAAGAMYNTSGVTVSSQAYLYGSQTGDKNENTLLQNVGTTPTPGCLKILKRTNT